MFKQGAVGNANAILLVLAFIMIASCLSSPVAERERRGAGAGNCNGGRNVYKTFCYEKRTGSSSREADVQRCFDALFGGGGNYGCRTRSHGRCRCTVDSSFIWNWEQAFKDARQSLYGQCHGFTNGIVERYEGKMYLTATCN